jgi:hypothetical protein
MQDAGRDDEKRRNGLPRRLCGRCMGLDAPGEGSIGRTSSETSTHRPRSWYFAT